MKLSFSSLQTQVANETQISLPVQASRKSTKSWAGIGIEGERAAKPPEEVSISKSKEILSPPEHIGAKGEDQTSQVNVRLKKQQQTTAVTSSDSKGAGEGEMNLQCMPIDYG
jgi:hypothetical protein